MPRHSSDSRDEERSTTRTSVLIIRSVLTSGQAQAPRSPTAVWAIRRSDETAPRSSL